MTIKGMIKIILVIIAVWLAVNAAAWVMVVHDFQTGVSVLGSMAQMEQTTRKLTQWLRWYPWLSLGAYRLPFISQAYKLVEAGNALAGEVIQASGEAESLGMTVLTGNGVEPEKWASLWDHKDGLAGKLEAVRGQLADARIEQLSQLFGQGPERQRVIDLLENAGKKMQSLAEIETVWPQMLGYANPQHYVVLTQNNMELWPTGGYLGSYVEFWLDKGALKNLKIESIDVPNGQIKGYVESPAPIVKYTHDGGTPGWRLRESNWNPDFPKAMPVIEWFFTEGGLKPIDTMAAINLIPVLDTLRVVGPVEIPDYGITLTADNFYQETEKNVEMGFFDGSTQKRDFLSQAGRQILNKIMNNPKEYLAQMLPILYRNLQTKQVMIATKEATTGAWLKQQGWDGSLINAGCVPNSEECIPDYLHINEANLGINKTNCCLDRQFRDKIGIAPGSAISHQLEMTYVNHNPAVPKPPEQWGGGYKAYVRLYVPKGSQLGSIKKDGVPITVQEITLESEENKTVIGFLVLVQGGQTGTFQVDYSVPAEKAAVTTNPTEYQLMIQKQSGVVNIPWEITVDNGVKAQNWQGQVDRDMRLGFKLLD
jgi:hypothetical protein